jgi:hypothetical protein
MEITCKRKMMFIPIEYVGWYADLLDKCIDRLVIPLLEHFRNDGLLIDLPGMLER